MSDWLNDIRETLERLGGSGSLSEIYKEVKKVREERGERLSEQWRSTVRAIIQRHSSDSVQFNGKEDIFYSVEGLGLGVWGLRAFVSLSPSDFEPPKKIQTHTYRILRDTHLARAIKALHKNTCQLCGTRIVLGEGKTYAEVHHIRPLGHPHNGPDIAENILVLCPNCHVRCDYGAIKINLSQVRTHPRHQIGQEFVKYHNEKIFKT